MVDNSQNRPQEATNGVQDHGRILSSANVAQNPQIAPTPRPMPTAQPFSPAQSHSRPRIAKKIIIIALPALALLIIAGAATWFIFRNNQDSSLQNAQVSERFNTLQIPLAEFAQAGTLIIDGSKTLSINGQLRANNSLIISPTSQPTSAVAGQIYYSQTDNTLNYYNGTSFVKLEATQNAVQSVGGLTGSITLGTGLSSAGGAITNSGVLSLQGQTGAIILTAGNGMAVDGTTISNSGVLAFGGQSGNISIGTGLSLSGGELKNSGAIGVTAGTNITVTNANGVYTISSSGGGSGNVSTTGGTSGKLAKFTGVNTIADSLVSETGSSVTISGNLNITGQLGIGTPLTVTNGGTGTNTLATNGVLLGNGTSAITAVTAGGAGLCLVSTAGAPAFSACPSAAGVDSLNGLTGALSIANASAAGSTITLNDASTSQKGIASFSSTNFTASSGAINTIQDINTTAAPTFGRLSVTSSQAASTMMLVNNANASATGNLLDLQTNSVSQMSVSPAGAMTLLGNINGQTISSTANFTGTLGVSGLASLSGGATVTGTLTANTVTPTSAMAVGATNQSLLLQGNASSSLTATNGASTTTVSFITPTANVTYRLQTAAAGTYDICTTVGNCAGTGGGVTTPGGTSGRIAKFTGSQTIADSLITETGTTISIDGDLSLTSGNVYQINGVQISSVNLSNDSNLAKLNATQTFTGATNSFKNASDSTNAFNIQNASSQNVLLIDTSNGQVALGNASALAGQIKIYNATNANSITIIPSVVSADRTLTLPNESGTFCTTGSVCAGYAASSGSTNYIQNQIASQQTADGWISGTFRADTALQSPGLDTGVSGALNIGTTNATAINLNKNTVMSAGVSLTVTGGATGTRPGSPTEGMVYYDSTTKQLLTYANGKWQSDRNSSTKVVAASDSAQALKDMADYVADGTNDEVEINAALTAAAGGRVYLTEGTYTAGATIFMPNNTALAGSGKTTIIKLAALGGVSDNLIQNTDTSAGTGIVIQDLTLDGQKSLQTGSPTQVGIYINGMGSGTGASALPGAKITNIKVINFKTYGIYAYASSNNTISDNFIQGSGDAGVVFSQLAKNNIVSGNTIEGNADVGIYIAVNSDSNTITNNIIRSNTASGIDVRSASAIISNNTISDNGNYGIMALTATNGVFTNNLITGNTSVGIYLSGSYGTVNSNVISSNSGGGIYIFQSNYIVIDGNKISTNTGRGVDLSDVTYVSVTSNIIVDNTTQGLGASSLYNTDYSNISGNTFANNGASGAYSAINLSSGNDPTSLPGGTSNTITNNLITDTAGTGYAILIGQWMTNTYLSNNKYSGTGASSISDSGVNTSYVNQVNSSGDIINRGQNGLAVGRLTATSTLSIQGSYVSSALSSPAAPTVTNVGTAGSTSYTYAISAYDGVGETQISSTTTTATGNATLNGTNYNRVSWTRVGGAVSYKIYRTASSGTPSSTGLIGTVASSSSTMLLNDTGLAGSGSTPAANTTGGMTLVGALQGTTATLSSANALTLGSTGTNTGAIVFNGSTAASGAITLIGQANPSNNTLTLPNETGTLCSTGSVCSGYATASGGSGYIQNQIASQQTANGWISGTLRADTSLQTPLLDTATATTLAIGTTNATVINLNQNTTVTAGKQLTVTSALTTLTGATTGDALAVSNSTSTGRIAVFKDNSTEVVVIGDGGATSVTTTTDSATAFTVQGTAGSPVLYADTYNNTVRLRTLYAGNTGTFDAIWLQGNKNGVTTFIGGNDNVDAYGANESSGNIRWNGSNYAWGDFGYYPMGGGDGNYGQFRFSTTGSAINTTPNAKVGVGSLYAATNIGVNVLSPIEALDVSGNINVGSANSYKIGGVIAMEASGGYLRINQSNQSSNGIYTGTSGLRVGGTTGILVGSAGGDGQIGLIPNGVDNTRRITLDGGTGAITTLTGSFTGATSGDALTVSNSTSTGNILLLKDNSTTVASVTDGGAATFQNSTNSAAAFRVLNSAGSSLFSIDSTNGGAASLLGMNSGETGSWNSAATTLTGTRAYAGTATANGYVYVVGGNSTTTAQSTVYYAKINSDGTTGAWTTNTYALPVATAYTTATAQNGYLYVLGGSNSGGTEQTTVYFTRLNSDGSTGSWNTTTVLPAARSNGSAVAVNGYMYYIGGQNSSDTAQNTTYYAKINSDGTLDSWTTGSTITNARKSAQIATANGYIYVAGGVDNTGTYQTSVYYAALNAGTGTIGTFATTSALPGTRAEGSALIANGYMYVIGGRDNSTYQASVYYSKLNGSDGTAGTWATATNVLPAARGGRSAFVANGYLCTIGGYDGSNTTAAAYSASVARVQIGASLDLVGLQTTNATTAGDTTQGSAGGSITAGNGTFVGNMQVQGLTNLSQGLNVNGITTLEGNTYVAGTLALSSEIAAYEGFENVTFPPSGGTGTWTTGGNANWARDTTHYDEGIASAASGVIADNQSSWLDVDYTWSQAGSITFEWDVSSEQGYDYLVVCVDHDATCDMYTDYSYRISGIGSGWQQINIPMTAGSHSIRWLYGKDSSTSAGNDTAWIDNVRFNGGEGKITGNGINFSPATGYNITIGDDDSTAALLVLDRYDSVTDPAGTNGGMYYNTNLAKFRCYEDSLWKNCISASEMSRYYAGSAQTIANSTDTRLTFDYSETSNAPITVTDDNKFTFNRAGKWEVSATTRFGASGGGTGERYLTIAQSVPSGQPNPRYAQQTTPASASYSSSLNVSTTMYVDDNDVTNGLTISIYAFQNSGGNLNTDNSWNGTCVSITWLGY